MTIRLVEHPVQPIAIRVHWTPIQSEGVAAMPEYITLTPTDQGYESMAAMFLANVLDDVPARRRAEAAQLIGSAIECVMYLARKADTDADYIALRERITKGFHGR